MPNRKAAPDDHVADYKLVRIRGDLYQKVIALAKAEERPISRQLNRLIEAALAEQNKK